MSEKVVVITGASAGIGAALAAQRATLPDSQSVEEAAAVIAGVIDAPRPDVYTRPGSHDRVVAYYDRLGADP